MIWYYLQWKESLQPHSSSLQQIFWDLFLVMECYAMIMTQITSAPWLAKWLFEPKGPEIDLLHKAHGVSDVTLEHYHWRLKMYCLGEDSLDTRAVLLSSSYGRVCPGALSSIFRYPMLCCHWLCIRMNIHYDLDMASLSHKYDEKDGKNKNSMNTNPESALHNK